jgi:hypothetical protein
MTLKACSIPKTAVLLAAQLLLLSAVGCNSSFHEQWYNGFARFHEQNIEPKFRASQHRFDPVMPDPQPDEAATARDWERSTYRYPNGTVVAYPTYNPNYEEQWPWAQNDYMASLTQPAVLVADALFIIPVMFVEPPWWDIKYHGAQYPPSMTVAPPLPAE